MLIAEMITNSFILIYRINNDFFRELPKIGISFSNVFTNFFDILHDSKEAISAQPAAFNLCLAEIYLTICRLKLRK